MQMEETAAKVASLTQAAIFSLVRRKTGCQQRQDIGRECSYELAHVASQDKLATC